jgi:hypothetical protein
MCRVLARRVGTGARDNYLLLLHETVIGAIVHDTFSKDGRSQMGVRLLGANLREPSIEHKVIALGAQADSHLLSEQNERKDIAILS